MPTRNRKPSRAQEKVAHPEKVASKTFATLSLSLSAFLDAFRVNLAASHRLIRAALDFRRPNRRALSHLVRQVDPASGFFRNRCPTSGDFLFIIGLDSRAFTLDFDCGDARHLLPGRHLRSVAEGELP